MVPAFPRALRTALFLALFALGALFSLLTTPAHAQRITVSTVEPPPHDHAVSITASITISLAAPIDDTSLISRHVTLYGAQQGPIDGNYTVSGTTLTIMPSQPFFPGELVQTTIPAYTYSVTSTMTLSPFVSTFRAAAAVAPATFVQPLHGITVSFATEVEIGDLDNDGDLDLVYPNVGDDSSVWLNDGSGTFRPNETSLENHNIALGDFDGDGDLDIAVDDFLGIYLWRNDGSGTFTTTGDIFIESRRVRDIEVGDLDGDGDMDAAIANACDPFDPNQLCDYSVSRIWWNQADGEPLTAGPELSVGTSHDIALGDLDNDGDLDVVLARYLVRNRGVGSAVWTNLGNGVFTQTQALDALHASSVELGDLDGDGDLDAIFGGISDDINTVWLNDGTGQFTPGQKLGAVYSASLGDFDGDGDLDAFVNGRGLLLTTRNYEYALWHNQGDGTFVKSTQLLRRALASDRTAVGDLDGDGDLDAVTSGDTVAPETIVWENRTIPPMEEMRWLPLTPFSRN